MELIFDWDVRKARSNLKDHRIGFEEAKTVFNDPLLLTFPDEFHSETEERFISIGYSSRQRLLLAIMGADDWMGLVEWLEEIKGRQIMRTNVARLRMRYHNSGAVLLKTI